MRRLAGLWLAWFLLIAGVNLASPLYHVYAERFSFSPLVLTAIFSTYAIVLVPALVLFVGCRTGSAGGPCSRAASAPRASG